MILHFQPQLNKYIKLELDDFEKSYRKWIASFEDAINDNKTKKGVKQTKAKASKTINTSGKEIAKEPVKQSIKQVVKQEDIEVDILEEKPKVKKNKNIKIIDTSGSEVKVKPKSKK